MIYYRPFTNIGYRWFFSFYGEDPTVNRADGVNSTYYKYAVFLNETSNYNYRTNTYDKRTGYNIQDVKFKNKREKTKKDII